jgi:5-methyltetrahydrofolate--homocysteine methyltransferase
MDLQALHDAVVNGEIERVKDGVRAALAGNAPADQILHDIGKDLVIMMLEGAGYRVTDLGVNVPPDQFVQAAKKGAQLIGLSALLTTTMPNMKATLDALKEAGLRDRVKVLIGGAPLTQAYADRIGADGYAPDASAAVRKAKELLAQLRCS